MIELATAQRRRLGIVRCLGKRSTRTRVSRPAGRLDRTIGSVPGCACASTSRSRALGVRRVPRSHFPVVALTDDPFSRSRRRRRACDRLMAPPIADDRSAVRSNNITIILLLLYRKYADRRSYRAPRVAMMILRWRGCLSTAVCALPYVDHPTTIEISYNIT